jgi:1A family penicillin-binding protein
MKEARRPLNHPRRPAYRTSPVKTYQKPFRWLGGRWRTFRSFSRKKQIAIVGGVLTAILVIIPPVSYLYFVRDIKDQERLMNRKSTGIIITDKSGEVIYSYGRTPNEKFYKLDEISDDLEKALIDSEDQGFYDHQGFSVRSIGGAVIANVLNKDLTKYGGSTITQQLVKNNLLTSSKNFLRKYQELSLAIAIEREYTKDEILEMYLNSVYFGEGAFGIGRAAEVYYGKSPQQLSLAESSMLIGLLPAPSAYSPVSGDGELAKQQQERVLNKMVEAGDITEEQKNAQLKDKLTYEEAVLEEQKYAHHFTQMILRELSERYGEERVTRGGFTVQSTLDLGAQREAERAVKDQISYIKHLGATNSALVAIDPKTGEIRALVGSVNWENKAFGQVNMATTPRQPGSSFKPIYYTEALEKEIITPSTVLHDERRVFADGYRPENYDFRFRGDVTVRYALALSLNIPAIEVMEKLGVREAAETARRMGIDTITEPEKYGLPLALGTAEAELVDMTNAYAAFANKGYQHPATTIQSISDKYGKRIFKNKIDTEVVQSPQASYLISSILSDEKARSGLSGSALNLQDRRVAVKTGTTNDNVDAWTIGYTPSLAVGVWVGDNKHKPMQLAGTSAAGPIWRRVMEHMLSGTTKEEFQRPSRIIEQAVCSVNGSYEEVYIQGSQPDDHCNIPSQAELDAIRRREEEEAERRRQQEEKDNQSGESGEEEGEEETIDDTDETDDGTTEEPPDDGTTEEPPDGGTVEGEATTEP